MVGYYVTDTYFYDVNKAWKFSCFNSLTTHLAEKVIAHQTSDTNVLITSWICHYTIYYILWLTFQWIPSYMCSINSIYSLRHIDRRWRHIRVHIV